jgi:hypothetical protein
MSAQTIVHESTIKNMENWKLLLEVLTAVSTMMAVFWVVAPCTLAEVCQCCSDLGCHRRQYGPLKRRWTSTGLHAATTQKTAIFTAKIVDALSDKICTLTYAISFSQE